MALPVPRVYVDANRAGDDLRSKIEYLHIRMREITMPERDLITRNIGD
jgi:hypothetical protein